MANFYARIAQSVERFPDNTAVELQRAAGAAGPALERYTYRELRALADGTAAKLKEGGIAAGDRCAILAQNGPRWLAAYMGTISMGAVAVPLDTNFNAGQIAKLLKDSGARLMFTDARDLPAARQAVSGLDTALFELESMAPGPVLAPVSAEASDTAVILYTSGTTSDPKGVMLTHGSLAAEMDAVYRIVGAEPGDAILGVLPLFHALAQMSNLLWPLSGGARVVFLETLNTTELLRALTEREITMFVCVPQFFYLIHERVFKEAAARGKAAFAVFRMLLRVSAFARGLGLNLGKVFFGPVHRKLGPSIRYLVTGGSRMDLQVCRDYEALGFSFLQAYGLSETSGAVFATRPDNNVLGSVGIPMHGVSFKLSDPKPSEEAAGREVGEIVVSGPMVMKGYHNRPEATAAVLKDGWFSTGDLGCLDDKGNLFICGRIKEMIVLSSGKNIYPEEIETHYQQSPFIKEVCVLGLTSRPGEPFSERLHGVVVPDWDVLREKKIVNAREVIRFDLESLSAKLPATKRILSYDLRQDPLPRTTTKKIKRFEVEKQVKARQAAGTRAAEAAAPRALSAEDSRWLSEPQVERALKVIKTAAKNEGRDIHPKDNIELDLGLDSMERVELLAALERELGAHVKDWATSQVFTVQELVDVVRANVGASGTRAAVAWEAIFSSGEVDPVASDILTPRPITDRLWGFGFALVYWITRAFYGLRVEGLENLPKDGPFILSPNHQSFLDGPVLVAALPFALFRRTFYVGTSEIFGEGLGRMIARSLRLIPIDPDANLIQAMKAGAFGLSQGKALVLFPEGERSIDGLPKTFKKGAAILSAHLQVPIVPVALEGFHEAWPRGESLRFSGKLRMVIGKPIAPPAKVEPGQAEAVYAKMTADLRERVVSMWEGLRQPAA